VDNFLIQILVILIGPWMEASCNRCWIWMRCCFISWEISCEQRSPYWVSPGIWWGSNSSVLLVYRL